jgi:hypothetical protein
MWMPIRFAIGSSHPPDLCHAKRYGMDQSFLGLSLKWHWDLNSTDKYQSNLALQNTLND